uniref:Uncharacterized protein n=1 Tax=Setaria digitata TaxID=48799 RepID=A0A915PSR5_9BILA
MFTSETLAFTDTDIINKLLGKGYDWRVRPPGTNLSIAGGHGPVVVSVNMLIRSISKIDDVNMEYSVQLTFRESWVDGRLAFGYPRDNTPDFVILTAGQQIWMPDSFFQNEKQAQRHMIDKPNVLIRVHKDGTILYSVRISLVLSCPMHLQSKDPVQLKEGLHSSLPSFQLSNVTTTFCTSKTNTGTYSCLRTVLELRRQFSYYLLQLYVPSSMLVVVSWVSFWLDRTAIPARVTLGVTTFLTMTTQASGINAKLPPVSYTKAIDVWIGGCKRPNVLLERSNQMAATQLIIFNKNAMECGEIWVRQKNDSEEESAERMNQVNDEGNKRRRYRRSRQTMTEYYRQCRLIGWLRNKFDTTDRAKQADYLSSLFRI